MVPITWKEICLYVYKETLDQLTRLLPSSQNIFMQSDQSMSDSTIKGENLVFQLVLLGHTQNEKKKTDKAAD